MIVECISKVKISRTSEFVELPCSFSVSHVTGVSTYLFFGRPSNGQSIMSNDKNQEQQSGVKDREEQN